MKTTVVINVYHDEHLAERLLRQLRLLQDPRRPNVLLIFDGLHNEQDINLWGTTPAGNRASLVDVVHYGERLKLRPTGEWTQRYLKLALEEFPETDLIVKMDPDTCVNSWVTWPFHLDYAGTLSRSKLFVRGGACSFSWNAATRLVESGLLLGSSPHLYRRYSDFRWPHEEANDERVSCQDQIVGDAMRALGYQPEVWPGINILGNDLKSPAYGSGAITHPHPTL